MGAIINAEARMDFIREQLRTARRVVRKDLMERFGMSLPTASADLQRFMQQFPGQMTYDMSAKAYMPTAAFDAPVVAQRKTRTKPAAAAPEPATEEATAPSPFA